MPDIALSEHPDAFSYYGLRNFFKYFTRFLLTYAWNSIKMCIIIS